MEDKVIQEMCEHQYGKVEGWELKKEKTVSFINMKGETKKHKKDAHNGEYM